MKPKQVMEFCKEQGVRMAGLDGIENRIDPGEPLDKDIYGLSPEELENVPSTPSSLEEVRSVLRYLNNQNKRGRVFSPVPFLNRVQSSSP